MKIIIKFENGAEKDVLNAINPKRIVRNIEEKIYEKVKERKELEELEEIEVLDCEVEILEEESEEK